MPSRQELDISVTMPVAHFAQAFSLQPPLCAMILFGVVAFGPTAASAQETRTPQTQSTSSSGQAPVALSVFPDIASSTKPLSTGQKFQLFVDNSISVNALATAALGSAISQADNSPTGFGQGWDAYAKRFGSAMGSQASSEFFGTFVLASALHQDPRFYPEANPTFSHAVKYSVQRIFVTRNDDGRDVANWSGLAGPLMAEGLANVYWPERNRTVGDTFLRYGLDLASRAGGNMLREYWPVIRGKFRRAPRPAAGNN